MPKFYILDLDKTLILTKPISSNEILKYTNEDGFIISDNAPLGLCFVRKRKHLDYFIKELKNRGKTIIVWSAGAERYVKSICDILFGRDTLEYILTRIHWDFCKETKNLELIKSEGKVEGFDLSNSVLIDDDIRNKVNDDSNFIYIKPFDGSEDEELLRVLDKT